MTIAAESQGDDRKDWLDSFVREHRGRRDLPVLQIHPNDEMHHWGRRFAPSQPVGELAYFRAGMVISDTVRSLAEQWFGSDGPDRYLDFACGYGRSLRFTIEDFGPSRVWGCEILPDANDFVAEVLGANSFPSVSEPQKLEVDRQFDLIFVSSLFSHLPDRTFGLWLTALHRLLSDGGLLVVSVHDEVLLPQGATLDERGYYFQPTTEVASLDPNEYGATVVNEDYVAAAIEASLGMSSYRRFRTALCFEQDLYAIPASADDPRLINLRAIRGPQGAIDDLRYEDRHLILRGWAATQDEHDRVRWVEIRLDGELVGLVRTTHDRPDVATAFRQEGRAEFVKAGWIVDEPWERPLLATAVLTATAITSTGERGTFYGVPLSELMPGLAGDSAEADLAPDGSSRLWHRDAPLPSALYRRALNRYRSDGLRGVAAAIGSKARTGLNRTRRAATAFGRQG